MHYAPENADLMFLVLMKPLLVVAISIVHWSTGHRTKVTPIHEWWYFKRPPREEGKMSVKEAEELMKKQEHFVGPLSLANKIEKIIKTVTIVIIYVRLVCPP